MTTPPRDSERHDSGVREAPLPPLSAADAKIYNAFAERMDFYHEHFRLLWKEVERLCEQDDASARLSRDMRAKIIRVGLQFCYQLNIHHSIEEQHIFPGLAERMPNFGKHGPLVTQHVDIHNGLDRFQDYLGECRSGAQDLEVATVKRLMAEFGGVLWQHLDEEVQELAGENMRKYWTLDEMREMPM